MAAGGSLFDEYIERRRSDTWLLYSNNIWIVSAMAKGGDCGVFEDGSYYLTKALMEMDEWLKMQERLNRKP